MIDFEYNKKAIIDTYKNAHIALQSISDILGKVENKNLQEELKNEYDGYEKIIGKISSYLKENDIEPKDIGFFKKAMLWSSINMKTMINNSKNQIAEMMIQGTVMGINELTAMQNEKERLDPEIAKLIDELLKLEEDYNERLKKYL